MASTYSSYVEPEEDADYAWTPSVEPGDVPSAVRNLLQTTQQLQEVLKSWACNTASEEDVSNTYVQIGHQFNDAIAAFAHYQIDLTDIHCFPSDLRIVLEGCLSEDPMPRVYDAFIGKLRGVIWKMLKGLQARQAEWKFMVAQQQPFAVPQRVDSLGSLGSARSDSTSNGSRVNGTNYEAWLQAQHHHQQ